MQEGLRYTAITLLGFIHIYKTEGMLWVRAGKRGIEIVRTENECFSQRMNIRKCWRVGKLTISPIRK